MRKTAGNIVRMRVWRAGRLIALEGESRVLIRRNPLDLPGCIVHVEGGESAVQYSEYSLECIVIQNVGYMHKEKAGREWEEDDITGRL
jgi:hypothetical protein